MIYTDYCLGPSYWSGSLLREGEGKMLKQVQHDRSEGLAEYWLYLERRGGKDPETSSG
jgi:hypothetical protein